MIPKTFHPVIQLLAAVFSLGLLLSPAQADEPIVIGLPITQSGPFGVADHQDHLNGTELAVEEINAAGGVNGRPLEIKVIDTDILTPEGVQAGFQALVDAGVHAISSPFVIAPAPSLDVAAAYGAPYLHGSTQTAAIEQYMSDPQRYKNVFQVDPPEAYYGTGYIKFLDDLSASGKWEPKNNKIFLLQERFAYNEMIAKTMLEAVAASNGKWEVVEHVYTQSPIQDWGQLIHKMHKSGAGIIMLDHWVAAEYATFAQQWAVNPVPGALVYMQYGPSQPEFLELAGESAEGMVWSTVLGVVNTGKGAKFREAYKKKFPGVMGLAYTGMAYDVAYILKAAWESVGDPNDFEAVNKHIENTPYQGTVGAYVLNTDCHCSPAYPGQVDDPEKGMAHLYLQVQGGEHKIISPDPYIESDFKAAPWM